MSSLPDLLTDPSKKSAVVEDALVVLDEEVADKKGVSGMAIKTGYKTVKNVKPGFLRGAVEDLLPPFAEALDPIYQEAKTNGQPVESYFSQNSDRVADSLLAITDERAKNAKTQIVKATYNRLRGYAKTHVEAAVPRVGRLVEKHAS